MTEKTVLVPVADGSEDIETVSVIDVLRRAEINVVVASVMKRLQVRLARGCQLVCDVLIEDIVGGNFDMIVLPGGMPGASNLRECTPLANMLKKQKQQEKWYIP